MTSRLAALAEVCQINPKLPKPHGLSGDDEVSFVPMAAIDEISGAITNAGVRRFDEVKRGYTAFFENDVLFAKITPCMENGKAAVARNLVGGVGFGSTEFHVLRADESVLPEWLYYFLRRKAFRDEAKRNFTGTGGQQRVPATFIANARLPLPSLADQRCLVDILSRAEGIVRLRREAQEKAAELIPAIFIDMFGDPATNPKGWPRPVLGELLANGLNNGLYKHKSAYGAGTPILRIDAFYDGVVKDLESLKRVRVEPDELRRFGLTQDDIVINRVNSPEYLGKSTLIPALHEPTVFESNMMRFAVDQSRLVPRYLIALLQTAMAKQHFLSNAKHAINQSSINQQDVKAIPVILPPREMQLEFSRRTENAESILRQQSDSLDKATATFDALLAQAFDPAASL